MVDKNDSLLREVEEELRHDQLRKLWTDYGTFLIAAAALLVVGVFVYQQVESRRIAASEAAGAQFEAARKLIADKKPELAEAAFSDIAKSGPAGYAALARFQIAAAQVKADKSTDAVATFDSIVADNAADGVLRDFARLQAAGLRVGSADWTEMENRLTPLNDEKNAFRASARELLGLAAQKAGKNDDARKLFLQVLQDGKSSQSLKDRVAGYLSMIVTRDLNKPQSPAVVPAVVPAAVDQPAKAPEK